jgi:peroxiredoxin Q/BCP
MEACNLRDNYELLQQNGFELLGVSADNQKRQTNFRKKYDFPFPLLADENKEVIRAFGVWGLKKFMGREYDGIHRKTFLIDEKGVVMRVIDKVKTRSHASQILEENE